MTRKHYKEIAGIIRDIRHWSPTLNDVIEQLANYFAKDNPRFNKAKFLKACRLE